MHTQSQSSPIARPGQKSMTYPNLQLSSQLSLTKEQWEVSPIVTTPNVLLIEAHSLSPKMKVSDGVHAYKDLPYLTGAALSDAYTFILENANKPGGIVVLTEEGIIPPDLLPKEALETHYSPRFYRVPTYENMLKACHLEDLRETMECSIIIVADATGDPQHLITSNLNPAWYRVDMNEVVPEIELIIDFNSIVVGMSQIQDDEDPTGTSPDKYLKFSYADKAILTNSLSSSTILRGNRINAARLAEIMAL